MATSIINLLAGIPSTLHEELMSCFKQIEKNFREGRWEPSELNGGKLCEVVYTILRGYIDNNFPASASKPRNMVDACRALEQSPATFPRSIRIQIPRMITALYEIRNNRGVGHVGGDVNPNKMDAICVLQMSKWIITELIRVFHSITISEAEAIVDSISEREISIIWAVGNVKRVLDTNLSMASKSLVLLYNSPLGMSVEDLVKFTEHSNPSSYKSTILKKAHKERLLEYDKSQNLVTISPKGMKKVEVEILK